MPDQVLVTISEASDISVEVLPPSTIDVEVIPLPDMVIAVDGGQGPSGPPGPQGPAGTGLNYTHDQPSASAVWLITHNMGKYPSISVVDSSGSVCIGHEEYLSPNQVRITFTAPFSGQAFLN